MSIRSFIQSIQSFLKNKRGNVAPLFALAIIPAIGLTGAAVDYSRANSVKTALQSALDATALAMAKSASTLTAADLQQKSTDYFNAVFNRPEAKNVSIVAAYSTTSGTQLSLTASGSIDTTFTRVMGITSLGVGSSSTIKWGNTRLRVALVLDTTGSMADAGKIGALQTATKSLLDQLKTAAQTPDDVYVSIIPFSKDVNVGSSGNGSATWLQFDDGTDRSWDGTNGTCSISGYSPRSSCQAQSSCSLSGYSTQSSCTAAGTCSVSGNSTQNACSTAGTCSLSGNNTQSACTGAGTCSISGYNTQSNCTSAHACSNTSYTTQNKCTKNGGTWNAGVWTPGAWTAATWTAGAWTQAVWTPNNHSTWNGCVLDRGSWTAPGTTAGNDQRVTAPTTSDATTLFYPEQYGYCSAQVMPLNNSWSTMKTAVDALYPNGNTNQAIGLAHGWQSLVGGGPYPDPPPFSSNYIYNQVIILLTDGLNTQDRWYTSQTSIDNRQRTTCDNINAANITLYTIQVNTGGDPTSSLLRNCAGTAPSVGVARTYPDTSKFFTVTSSSGIGTVFNQIATQLSQLRIAQ
jgi:Flp pilus assembly protein TadG